MVAGSGSRPTKRHGRLVGLDGLRGVLSLCVILVHTTAHFSPTILGKTHIYALGQAIVIFFVMSGFLIYYPFAKALLEDRNPFAGMKRYARARGMRVFPAYIVIFLFANLTATLFLENAMVVQQRGGQGGTGSILDPSLLLLNLTVLQNYFPSLLQTGISSSWTLTVELAFYFLLPFLAVLIYALARKWGRGMPRYLIAAIPGALLVLGGFVWRVVAAMLADASGIEREMSEWGPNWVAVLSRSILPWSDNFGGGMLATVLYLAILRGDLAPAGILRARKYAWFWGALFLIVSGVCYFLAPRFIAAAFAVFSVAFLLLIVLPSDGESRHWRFAVLLDNRVCHWLGVTSLSTYLVHFPVMLLCERFGLTRGDTWGGWVWNFALVTVVSVALASVSYMFVEKPALELGSRKKQKENP